jgi:hypothetical protein
MFSTVEALILLLEVLGEVEAAETLRIQFELHVYAGLRSRGAVREAAQFLVESPLASALPEVLQELQRRRASPGRAGVSDPAARVGHTLGTARPEGHAPS